VGRGTDTPFELFGAPWIDGPALARYLNQRRLAGVRFYPIDFTAQKPYPCAGEVCHGVHVVLIDRNALDAPEMGVEIASALHRLYPDQFHLKGMNTLLSSRAVLDAITAGTDPRAIAQGWRAALAAFERQRRPALLYSDK
jgi:uncharacterized protein YbbC (DUF1343 family)